MHSSPLTGIANPPKHVGNYEKVAVESKHAGSAVRTKIPSSSAAISTGSTHTFEPLQPPSPLEKIGIVSKKINQKKVKPAISLDNLNKKWSMSTPTTWSKFKTAVYLLFLGITQAVRSSVKWDSSQKTASILSKEYFSLNGEKLGAEIIDRKDGITDLIASKKAEKAFFSQTNLLDPNKLQSLEKEIEFLESHANGDKWVTSNRLRDEAALFQKGQNKLDASATYIPAVVNHRSHKICYMENGEEKEICVNRSGAISHLGDGSTNLQLLKANNNQPERLAKRRAILNDQMVQYLKGQVTAFASSIKDADSPTSITNTLQVTQISLLNQKKEKVEKGILISERNQMGDMAEIFDEFNGRQIQFVDEIEQPFLYGNVLLMPKSALGEMEEVTWERLKAKPLNLSCTFLNCSVQGAKKNNGNQAIINLRGVNNLQANLARLEAVGINVDDQKKELSSIEEALQKEESSFEIAQKLLILQHDMGGTTGVNCFSGKDRTGYFLIQLAFHYLSKGMTGTNIEKAQQKLATDLTSLDSLTSDLIEQNTGYRFMKIKEVRVLGMNSKYDHYGLVGYFLRMTYALNALFAKN